VDDKGVGEALTCRCIGRGESSWFAMIVGEDEVGVDAEGVGEGPPAKLFGEGPPGKRCFGGGDVREVTEDGGDARRQRRCRCRRRRHVLKAREVT